MYIYTNRPSWNGVKNELELVISDRCVTAVDEYACELYYGTRVSQFTVRKLNTKVRITLFQAKIEIKDWNLDALADN